jgi:hypothetical protein
MKHNEILDFLKVIDSEMIQHAKAGETLELHLIGKSANEALESAFAWEEVEDPKREKAYANLQTVIEYLEGNRRQL